MKSAAIIILSLYMLFTFALFTWRSYEDNETIKGLILENNRATRELVICIVNMDRIRNQVNRVIDNWERIQMDRQAELISALLEEPRE